MSVLIKGMTMPTRCADCPMCYDYIRCRLEGKDFGELDCIFELRADWCPLIEVPPHGDLISREWLIDISLHLMNIAKNDDIANGVKWLWQYVIEAPTIIESEEEDG